MLIQLSPPKVKQPKVKATPSPKKMTPSQKMTPSPKKMTELEYQTAAFEESIKEKEAAARKAAVASIIVQRAAYPVKMPYPAPGAPESATAVGTDSSSTQKLTPGAFSEQGFSQKAIIDGSHSDHLWAPNRGRAQ